MESHLKPPYGMKLRLAFLVSISGLTSFCLNLPKTRPDGMVRPCCEAVLSLVGRCSFGAPFSMLTPYPVRHEAKMKLLRRLFNHAST